MLPSGDAIILITGLALVYFPVVHFPSLAFHVGDYPFIPVMGMAMAMFGFLCCLQRTYLAIRGILSLSRQEKVLGFSFNDEMSKQNVTSTRYVSSHWFIDVRHNRNYLHTFIVLKRSFIKSIGKIEERKSAAGAAARTSIIVTTVDGKKQKVWISFTKNKDIIFDLRKWYRTRKSDTKNEVNGK